MARCAVGFGEEILFRGYLIPRASRVLGSEGAGLAVTAAIFGLSHAYQGVLGIASTYWWGLVSGAFFLVVPRIWPLALAHALNNFLFYVW
jgi:membrane protease YdiL (CAAX protease family)